MSRQNPIDLGGQICGRLRILYRISFGRRAKWMCWCECGNWKAIRGSALGDNGTQSCGCLKIENSKKYTEKQRQLKWKLYKENNLIGKTFNQLMVIELDHCDENKKEIYWKCKCDCGKEVIVEGRSLYIKDILRKSCGCLIIKNALTNIAKMIELNSKFTPQEATVRQVWQRYQRYDDNNGQTLSYQDFYQLTQQICHYCGAPPSCIAQKYDTEESIFIYSGLDRINSSGYHSKDNCVPCCSICNTAKSNFSIDRFRQLVINRFNLIPNRLDYEQHRQQSLSINLKILEETKYLKGVVNSRYGAIYNDGDLSMEQFYQLSQLLCYWCSEPPDIIHKEVFKNNGLDRIDNNIRSHNWDNVVACCKYCNLAKNDMTVDEFNDWCERTYQHLILTNW